MASDLVSVMVSISISGMNIALTLMVRAEAILIFVLLENVEIRRHWHRRILIQRNQRSSPSMDLNSRAHEWGGTKL